MRSSPTRLRDRYAEPCSGLVYGARLSYGQGCWARSSRRVTSSTRQHGATQPAASKTTPSLASVRRSRRLSAPPLVVCGSMIYATRMPPGSSPMACQSTTFNASWDTSKRRPHSTCTRTAQVASASGSGRPLMPFRCLRKIISVAAAMNLLVGLSGLEPLTSSLSGKRSNRLSYRPGCAQRAE